MGHRPQRRGHRAWLVLAAAAACSGVCACAFAATPAPGRALQTATRFEALRHGPDTQAALELGRQALEQSESEPGGGDPALQADLLIGLADVHVGRGDPQRAVELLERALELLERQLGSDHPDLVPTLDALAAAQQSAGRIEAAIATRQHVLVLLRGAYGEHHLKVREALQSLAALHVAAGRADEAARIVAEIESLERRTRAAPEIDLDSASRARRYTQRNGFASVRVFYGTNRAPTGRPDPARFFGTERGDLQFGYADVTVPETHREGELETPSRWTLLTLDMRSDEAKRRFVLLQSVQALPRDRFLESLKMHMGRAPSRELLLFVHGYNNSFEDASRRVAQLVYDLDFDGTPLLYSWPSAETTTGYTVDEAAVGISGRRLAEFLQVVVAEAGSSRVHLIAHSMGNRALLDALSLYLARRTPANPGSPLGQIVFTAPDVDRDLFVDAVQSLSGAGERLTLYASNSDRALLTSELLHGAPRAGLAGDRLVTLDGLDSIDMSAVEADMLGHSYFADDTGAMYDLFRLLWRGDPPPRRCGMEPLREAKAVRAFRYNVGDCGGQEVLVAGVLFKRFGNVASRLVRKRLTAIREPEQREEWQRILKRLDDLLKNGGAP